MSQAHSQFQLVSDELHSLQQALIGQQDRVTELELSLKIALD